MYKNKINFNCRNYLMSNLVFPENCYNCANRDGYPCNLGGDKKCRNFNMYERKKPDSIKILKREVWDLFSEWVRKQDSGDFLAEGYCRCVTCGTIDRWQNMQSGHFIHGTLFLIPELVHPQCPQCNGFKHGNLVPYKDFMIKRYGEQELAKLEFLAKRPHKYTVFELQQFKKLYQYKLKELQQTSG